MKQSPLKRLLVLFCTVSLLALLMSTFVSAASYQVTFQTTVPDSWGWTEAEKNALSYLEVSTADRSGNYTYSTYSGQTISFVSDYVDGSEAVVVFYNYGYYSIKLGVARSSPWTYLTEFTIPAATGDVPGMYVFMVSQTSYTNITFYTYSSSRPTYVGTPEGYFNVNINYYDITGTRVERFEMLNIQPSDLVDGYYTIPSVDGYTVVPQKIFLGSMPSSQITISAFLYDNTEVNKKSYESGYTKGYQEGLLQGSANLDDSIRQAFTAGLNEGLNQNALTYDQIQQIKTDYNVFTAFFDGIFSGFIQFYNTVTNGIAFGNISLNNVITVILSIVIVVAFASFIINKLS